jgi:hypothetical protein
MAGKETKFHRTLRAREQIARAGMNTQASFWWPDGQDRSYRGKNKTPKRKKLTADERIRRELEAERKNG